MSDPYAKVTPTSYTPDQLEALPQTTTVFDRPAMNFDAHEWFQTGYMIEDNCSPKRSDCHNVGIPIPAGKMLKRDERGRYQFVDELHFHDE